MERKAKTYLQIVWGQFLKDKIGVIALWVALLFFVVGLYAPFLVSSKPLFVYYDGEAYFPLFRYLFYSGFYTKRLDIFFNLLMFFIPLAFIAYLILRGSKKIFFLVWAIALIACFSHFAFFSRQDPATDLELIKLRQKELQERLHNKPFPKHDSWDFDLKFTTPYEKLNMLTSYHLSRKTDAKLNDKHGKLYAKNAESRWLDKEIREFKRLKGNKLSDEQMKQEILSKTDPDTYADVLALPTLWLRDMKHSKNKKARLNKILQSKQGAYNEATKKYQELSHQKSLSESESSDLEDAMDTISSYQEKEAELQYIHDREAWYEGESSKLQWMVLPLVRTHHWEDDVGGVQSLNSIVSWWEVSRSNSKDLAASLIFGVRVSMMVGVLAVALSLIIGLPIGVAAGYYGGKWDIFLSRVLEVWEALPVFFMLLFVVAITQSKSIFLVVAILGIFGWTGFARFVRGEVLKQKNLSYVLACRSMGFKDMRIMFSHILPNAIPPILTLVPFSIMAAMTSEAGLSFLGLGEEGSASWGVLMDEGRRAFPGESYLLWPPAIMLTLLLVAVALIGNSLRDAFDPKMHKD